jgi:sugar lactone lactonase YvrE
MAASAAACTTPTERLRRPVTLSSSDSEEVRLALPVAAALGEGLHWDARAGRLWLVDIVQRRLLRWDLQAPDWQEWRTPQSVGWVLPAAEPDSVLLGLQEGVARVRLEGPALTVVDWLARPYAGRPAMRLNDAKADATGAIWFGSLNSADESRPDGCLFRLGRDGGLSIADTGYAVANGPAIHPGGRLLLHTDSVRREIHAFDFDTAAGNISRKRLWRRFTVAEGHPDGMNFDAEGCLWVAHWGGACISRFDAEGRLLRRIALPTSNVTNVCFAGAERSRLFVTTARAGLTAAQLAVQAQAGALFEVTDPGTQGMHGMPDVRDSCVDGPVRHRFPDCGESNSNPIQQ